MTDIRVKDEFNKPMVFNGMIDVLNFFYNNGYKFVNAYVITYAGQNVYHYIVERNTAI